VKNVIALAAGMSEGLGLGMWLLMSMYRYSFKKTPCVTVEFLSGIHSLSGTNAMAALVTRGCIEMRRVSTALGGRSSTVRLDSRARYAAAVSAYS